MNPAVEQTLGQVLSYFKVDPTGLDTRGRRMPIEIPGVGRNDLAKFFGQHGFRNGAEIGVEQGGFSEVLCKHNPNGHLYCVDAWLPYSNYREHVSAGKLDGFFEATKARLAPYRCTFIRAFSADAAKQIPGGSLDYVYIDANHTLPFVIADLDAWIPKVRKGGIISGHDMCRRTNQHGTQRYQVHVPQAIAAWTDSYEVYPWFILGRKDVRDGEVRDRPRSWFWINQ